MNKLNGKNVILMFADDLGYGDLSCFNENRKISTPAIDALLDRGVRFTDCHATSALCTPSRYGLLTGRYNWRSELKSSVLPGGADPLIERGRTTIATLFRRAGYYTACVGKWHLGLEWSRKTPDGSEYGIREEVEKKKNLPDAEGFLLDGMNIDFTKPLKTSPNDFGFDYFFGTAASLDQPPYVYIENRQALGVPDHVTGVFPLDRAGGSQQKMWQRGPATADYDFRRVMPDMQKKVLSLIDAHASEPFFIYYPCHAVHGPLLPPPEYEGKSGLNSYADTVLYLNDLVEELTDKLREKGIWENTVFVFASDNGCSGVADYPCLLEKGHNPSYIFRGKKADIYEGGHRVPLIISAPGVKENEKEDALVCLSDLFATFREGLSQEKEENSGEDSFSLLPLLNHEKDEIRTSVVHSSGDGSFSIRNKDWKLELTRNNGAGGHLGGSSDAERVSDEVPYQLYSMRADVRECFNIAPDEKDVCRELLSELLAIIENGRSTSGERQENAAVPEWVQLDALKKIKI